MGDEWNRASYAGAIKIDNLPEEYPFQTRSLSLPVTKNSIRKVKKTHRARRDVVILGNSKSGKSHLVDKFLKRNTLHREEEDIVYTEVPVNLKVNPQYCNDVEIPCSIVFCEIGESVSINLVQDNLKKCHAVIFLYSDTDRTSFTDIDKKWMKEVSKLSGGPVPKIVIANYRDGLRIPRQVERGAGAQLADSISAKFLEFHNNPNGVEKCLTEIARISYASRRVSKTSPCSIL